MAAPQIAPLAPDFVLETGMQVIVTAIDATTGSLVAGVNIANISLSVDTSMSADSNTVSAALPILVPTE